MPYLKRLLQRERDKTLYLLLVMLVHNLIYPLSSGGGIQPIIFYGLFSSMFVLAVFLLSEKPSERLIISLAGIVVFVSGIINSYFPGTLALPVLYLSVIVYHLVMIIVLVRYIFVAKRILIEVILAATSLYLILGSVYTAVYGLVEWLEPGSFVVSSGAELSWQLLLYYSYVTLTTVGYGDITPVKFYAQSLAAFEAITGVLYTVILLSRLVGLYESERSDYVTQ
ncbi:MAG: two pore domain potassium channel family protein [Anaerolineaceae bacterium]|nr:two pore domain potassium channel family protein [Anaerolineaceae bacterium]